MSNFGFSVRGLPRVPVRIVRRVLSRRANIWAFLGVSLALLIFLPGFLMGLFARTDLQAGRALMLEARDQIKANNPTAAARSIGEAEASFTRASDRIDSLFSRPARLVPIAGRNLKVASSVSQSGTELAGAGRQALELLELFPAQGGRPTTPIQNGTVNLAPYSKAGAPAGRAREYAVKAERLVSSTPERFLLPAVKKARDEALDLLAKTKREADSATAAAFLVPRFFGGEGSRTWVLGAENGAELRGRGGYIGSFGLLTADEGKLSLGKFQSIGLLPPLPNDLEEQDVPSEYLRNYEALGALDGWQNLNMSPNFPSGAKLILSQLDKTANIEAGGLISLDPIALSYLLKITGPIQVEGIPEILTSENLVEWALNRLYFLYGGASDERREKLSEIADAVWQKLLTSPNLDSRQLAEALGKAASERHLVAYSSDSGEQAKIEELNFGGHIKRAPRDYLLLFAQNAAENKMDYYLTRDIKYRGEIQPNGDLEAEVEVTIRNTAPASLALPDYIGGPRPGLLLGGGRTRNFFTLLTPRQTRLRAALRDGKPSTDFVNDIELGKRRFATFVELAQGESKTVAFRYRLPRAASIGSYKLTVQNQATVKPDHLSVDIRLPSGTKLLSKEGFSGGPNLSWEGQLAGDQQLAAEYRVPLSQRVRNRLSGWIDRN